MFPDKACIKYCLVLLLSVKAKLWRTWR